MLQLSRLRTGDFNGDGLTDFYVITSQGTPTLDVVHLNFLTHFVTTTNFTKTTTIRSSPTFATLDLHNIIFADFNGDGMTDMYQIAGDVSRSPPLSCI